MLAIRFNRVGKRNKAQFRIVVQEHAVAPGGRHLEVLGSYDPHQKKAAIDAEKIKYWISKGAQVSDSVWNLLVKNNIIEGPKRAIKVKKAPVKEAESEAKVEEVKEEKAEENKTEERPTEKSKKEELSKEGAKSE